jgi:hypothetical protein
LPLNVKGIKILFFLRGGGKIFPFSFIGSREEENKKKNGGGGGYIFSFIIGKSFPLKFKRNQGQK